MNRTGIDVDVAIACAVLLVLAFVGMTLSGCATLHARKQCRPQCETLRGPVWSLFGGPTIPPRVWDDCMSACEAREAAP